MTFGENTKPAGRDRGNLDCHAVPTVRLAMTPGGCCKIEPKAEGIGRVSIDAIEDLDLIPGSGNVFRDLGEPDADLRQAKAVRAG